MTINHCREGNIRQQHGYLTWQHLNSWRQSWTCFIHPMWMHIGPAGSNQVEAGIYRENNRPHHMQNEPPSNSSDRLLKFVSQVSSPASQERSEGGLQPDGDASKRSPQHRHNKKKKGLITFYEYFQKLFLKSVTIKGWVFCPLFCDSSLKNMWAQINGRDG